MYLDSRIKLAEKNAGIPVDDPASPVRLFSKPAAHVLAGSGTFGKLFVTLSVNSGFEDVFLTRTNTPGLRTTDVGGNFGIESPSPGFFSPASTSLKNEMEVYLYAMRDIAQIDRRSLIGGINVDLTGGTLTTKYSISDDLGGPAAKVTLNSSTNMNTLFTTSVEAGISLTTHTKRNTVRFLGSPNPDVPPGSKATGNESGLWSDAVRKACDIVGGNGNAILNRKWDVVMIMVIPQPKIDATMVDPLAVSPGDAWHLASDTQPMREPFRGVEIPANIYVGGYQDPANKKNPYTLNAKFTLDLFCTPRGPGFRPEPAEGRVDTPLISHELGHALGLEDLYEEANFRKNNAYFRDWAIMDTHPYQVRTPLSLFSYG